MGGQLRAVKRRIVSVQSTKKITRAMELISSSRIVKAQRRVEAARPYAEQMRALIASVSQAGGGGADHPLLRQPTGEGKIGMIVVAADRGLAGAYNSNVLRKAERDIAEHDSTRLFLSGKKAISYFRFRGYDVEHAWEGYSDQPGIENAREVARAAVDAFVGGEVSEVRITYTRYESALTQRPVVMRLLPADTSEFERDDAESGPRANYEFEPAPEDILGFLLPRYIEGSVLQAMLEAAASEHAARRRAMKAATDNADELIEALTRQYNQARQAEITTEIMEVIGGSEALSAGGRSDTAPPDGASHRGTEVARATGSSEELTHG